MASPSSNDNGTISEDDLQPALSDDDDTQDANTSDESEVEGGAPKRTKNAWVTLMSVDLVTELHTLIPGLADDELLVELGEATDAIKVSHVFSKVMMATLTSLSHVQKRAAAAFEEQCADRVSEDGSTLVQGQNYSLATQPGASISEKKCSLAHRLGCPFRCRLRLTRRVLSLEVRPTITYHC